MYFMLFLPQIILKMLQTLKERVHPKMNMNDILKNFSTFFVKTMKVHGIQTMCTLTSNVQKTKSSFVSHILLHRCGMT